MIWKMAVSPYFFMCSLIFNGYLNFSEERTVLCYDSDREPSPGYHHAPARGFVIVLCGHFAAHFPQFVQSL